MDLFSSETIQNILPYDGVTNYHGIILDKKQCAFYYQKLMETINFKNDEAIIFGKKILTKRKVAWYGESEYSYTYSKITKTANIFTKELLALKEIVEQESGETYNSCLLNLYHSGDEGMAYHSDGEKMLKENGAIASLSLGADRKFSFKHKENKQRIDIILEKGSLLVMKKGTQTNWLHRLPPTKKVNSPRINLTFRTIEL
ncbi:MULTISPECIES: alpha-ketoglutarate-dependent dioxygenase AlkB [unclassified Polaribacter]|uniref:alpha-ketoglutarate-dependent dioxygenase AlkB family protein n=1 Tax=unclassified Polaribacter TaxID=196858 RepID=UPI001C4E7512|nr:MULTISPECIES: alpha-ketoglutarate-dependent dioxygenase AlkB [unclassified Polaribacter]QXP64708.1 alpha-ketoglutarate-dependent dioxygenase AlkB [Polaribacter sp. HaHaR_3_91]QXP67206.1 alpha-ketoglutarate-dependent dioxygenase AlkB [Polaribacter sp. AHE13PA]QXP69338.1 alpha-ketoglutarate-dependent dioxygenase AlkB [Polaribacter sp. R2A056_3_33]